MKSKKLIANVSYRVYKADLDVSPKLTGQ